MDLSGLFEEVEKLRWIVFVIGELESDSEGMLAKAEQEGRGYNRRGADQMWTPELERSLLRDAFYESCQSLPIV